MFILNNIRFLMCIIKKEYIKYHEQDVIFILDKDNIW